LKRRRGKARICVSILSQSFSLSLSNSVRTRSFVCFCVFMNCVTRRLRIANHMVMDSCCRGDIVNIRVDFSRARSARRQSSTALWRFRASTSNSPSGRTWPHTNTHVRYIHHTYAQQDIRVCGDDQFQPPKRQLANSKALSLLRVSI